MSNNDDGVILTCSSSLSELDVDVYLEKKKMKAKEGEAAAAEEEEEEEEEEEAKDPPAITNQQQPPISSTVSAEIAVTFAESQSLDVDDMPLDKNKAEGLDTVSSLEERQLRFTKMNEGDSLNSGNNSNCSSAEVTTRTRLETMDSTNIDSNHDIDFGYDIDHRSGDPLPPSKMSKANGNTKALQESSELQPPPSECMQFARRVKKKWAHLTKQVRNAMLNVVVETSVKAATYPRTTIGVISVVAFALIALGLFTNFTVRLDNEKLFTPTSSEVVEFNEYLANFSMYEGIETDRRRQLQKARVLKRLIQERKLATTITVFDDQENDNNHNDNTTLAPTRVFSGEEDTEAASSSSIVVIDEDQLGGENSNTTVTVEIELVNSTESPTAEHAASEGEENEDGLEVDEVNNEEEEEEEENKEEEEEQRYYERGKGLPFPILVHSDRANIFTKDNVEKLFDIIDFVKAVPGYDDACWGDEWSFHNIHGENTCELRAITRFWNHNRTLFHEQIKTDEDLFDATNEIFYPDGGYADLPFVLAEIEEDERGRPVEGQAFIFFVLFKHNYAYASMVDHLLTLQAQWRKDNSHDLLLEFVAPDSFAREVQRAIIGDLPLIPVVFIVMCTFTMLVFLKFHKVYSRCLLGVGAVVTIFLSILSGYGILFAAGVPVTVMTNLLIFVIFGIGLDDTFIITGAYFRTDHQEDPVIRVRRTMEAVGSSIILTTITTSVAFILGCTSTIEPIRWLCLYAFPAIIIDFFYQITFFIAILVLDERRIQSNRMDCCICVRVPNEEDGDTNDENSMRDTPADRDENFGDRLEESSSQQFQEPEKLEKEEASKKQHAAPSDHIADRFMRWFASRLMRPGVKVFVMLVFVVFAAVCAYNTSKLRQRFNFKDLLPRDSYAASYADAVEVYSNRAIAVKVTFRFVDQADEEVRNQMEKYVADLVENVEALNEEPPIFWVREFRTAIAADPTLRDLPFYEQIRQLLHNPAVNDAFGKDIQWRDDGTIVASQVKVYVTDLDMDDVREQIKFFRQQREVTLAQPVNEGRKLWAFFGYDLLFHIFAFYEVAAGELAVTTVSSVAAVCVIAFVLIPHWSAIPIILPLLSVLYIEMMGILQMFGYSINVVTYVILVVSIGLLVDFIMHILLRYYESEYETREEKVKDALGTMGASILVGGLSTFLGVTPLIFSSSEIFSTVCLAFLAMVFLGVTHGLIVLPVILSYFGTESVIRHRKRLSLIQITAALSEKLHQSMDLSQLSHGRHHQSLEACRSKSQESELQV